MPTSVTTRCLAMLLMATSCAVVGASCCATAVRNLDPTETPLVSDEAAARIETAVAAGIPTEDIEEIEVALEDLREVDAEAHAEMSAKWDDVIANLKDADPSKWPYLKPYYVASLKRRRESLIDSTDTEESSITTSPRKMQPVAESADPKVTTAKKSSTADQKSTRKPHVARREVNGPGVAGKEEDRRATDRRANSSVERERGHGLTTADSTATAEQPDGWFFIQSEEELQAAERRAVRAVSYETENPSRTNDHRSRQPAERMHEPARLMQRNLNDPSRPSDDHWRDELAGTIRRLEAEIESNRDADGKSQDEAILRLLYLADGRHEAAARPVSSDSPDEREFWSNQLYGLSLLLDNERSPDVRRRATEAIAELRKANQHLGALADLVISNMAFCRRVTSFGIFEEFDQFEFTPGQTTLVYVELENCRSEHTSRGERLAFGGSYQIFDSHGHTYADRELAEYEEHAQQPRRDFFLHYRIAMPHQIEPGEYTLQLSIEDKVSHQIAQSQIRFEITDGRRSKSSKRR